MQYNYTIAPGGVACKYFVIVAVITMYVHSNYASLCNNQIAIDTCMLYMYIDVDVYNVV